MITIKFTYEAPRWTKKGDFIKQLALYCDLECTVESSTGLLSENGLAVCTGELENINKFKKKFAEAVSNYNN